MKNKNLIIIGVVILVVLIIGLVYKNNNQTTGEKETIKIGFSLPLTGNLAFAGEGAKIAAQMAKESFGDTKYNYELIFEDDEFKPEKTATVVNKLINIDQVNAIVSFGASAGNVTNPIAETNKIIHFGVTTDLVVASGDYNFIHFTLPAEQTKLFVSELQKRNIKKIAYFVLNSAGYLATEEDVKAEIAKAGIELVSEQKFNAGEKDFRSYISKAKLSGADIFVLGAQSPELDILTQQIKDSGVTTPITSINSFEVSKSPNLYEGQWYIGSAVPSTKFSDAFLAKAGYSTTFGAANVYDITSLIIEGAESGRRAPTQEALLKQIKEIKDFDGALGLLNLNSDGAVISKAALKTIKEGKPVLLEE